MLETYGASNRNVFEHICIAEFALASQAKAAVGLKLILELSDLCLEFIDVLPMQIPGSLCCLSVFFLLQFHPLLLAKLRLIVLATILLLFYCFLLVLAVLIGREGLCLVTVEGQGLPLRFHHFLCSDCCYLQFNKNALSIPMFIYAHRLTRQQNCWKNIGQNQEKKESLASKSIERTFIIEYHVFIGSKSAIMVRLHKWWANL